MTHRVRTHIWRNGRLEIKDAYFESVGEAVEFAQNADGHSVKIYGQSEQLTHDFSPDVVANTYA